MIFLKYDELQHFVLVTEDSNSILLDNFHNISFVGIGSWY